MRDAPLTRAGPRAAQSSPSGRTAFSFEDQRLDLVLDLQRVEGSRGDCFDNAVAESFFATLKKELIRREGRFRRGPICGSRCSTTSKRSSTEPGGTPPSATSPRSSTRRSISINQERTRKTKPPSVHRTGALQGGLVVGAVLVLALYAAFERTAASPRTAAITLSRLDLIRRIDRDHTAPGRRHTRSAEPRKAMSCATGVACAPADLRR